MFFNGNEIQGLEPFLRYLCILQALANGSRHVGEGKTGDVLEFSSKRLLPNTLSTMLALPVIGFPSKGCLPVPGFVPFVQYFMKLCIFVTLPVIRTLELPATIYKTSLITGYCRERGLNKGT